MSTGKTFALAIALKATIDSSLASGIAKAAQSIQSVAQTAHAANAQLDKGTAALRGYESELSNISAKSAQFITLKRAIQDNSNSLTEARARAAALAGEFKASQQETAALKARVDQAKESLDRMKGTLTPATFKAAKAELKSMTAAYKESEERTKALGRDFEEAKNKAARLKDTLSNQQAALQGVRTSLTEAGISTKNFAESQRTAQEALQKTIDKEKAAIAHREKMAGLREKRQGASEKFSAAKGNFMEATLFAGAIAAPLIEATHEAIKFESVMADVRKVVDFDTPQQFKTMSGDILKLSTELPMAAEGIAQIVAAGGQSGIAREDLLAFAESATKMGIAFDITADQAGDMMAKWRTAFKMNQEEVVALADKVNYLGNTTAASAPLISDVVTRIGPLGEVGGVASGEIAALGASMVGVGIPSEVAATGIKNLILGMAAGEGATKSQAAAFAALGMTAEDVASRMQVDAKGAIIDVMKALQELNADKRAATLQDLFGKESIGAIAPLLGNLENLQENFDKVADAAQYAGSMEQEYAARSQTTENQIQLAKNALDATQISIGNALLPAIGNLFAAVAPVLTSFGEWASKNQELVAIIAGVAAGIAALIVAIAGMTLIVQGAALAYASFQLAAEFVKGLELATRIATAAQWAWNIAMSANPLGMIVIAIAAVVGALYLLYTHFDGVREYADKAWEGIKAAWASVGEFFTQLGADIVDAISSALSRAGAFFTGLGTAIVEGIQSFVSAAIDFIMRIPERVVFAIGFMAGIIISLPRLYLRMVLAIAGFLMRLPGYCMEAGTAFFAVAIAWLLATHTAFIERITQIVNDTYTFLMNLPAYCMETGMAFLSAAAAWLIAAYTTVITWITNIVNEAYTYLMNLPTYCTEAGASFVAAADAWASDAYDAVMNWISQIPEAISNTLSGAWENIKASFSGGFTVGVDAIAANARGGIYQRGAFLTTFAEDSAEAAIPIDGSARAASLWRQTGEMLGLLPNAKTMQESAAQTRPPKLTLVPPITNAIQNAEPQAAARISMMQMQAPLPMQNPTVMAMPPSSGGVSITFNPTIHIDGAVDAGVVEQLRVELERQKQELIAMLPALIKRQDAHERRLSYA
nr:phage tail tape measure protein [uncultured Selenomonas sp.]DAV19477.1 MAG TPA: minor tail protein [Caudoviricetes sp.]